MPQVILQSEEQRERQEQMLRDLAKDPKTAGPLERECAETAARRLCEPLRWSTDLKLAVQIMSGGTNDVLYDDTGRPSIMAVLPKQNTGELLPGGEGHFCAPLTAGGVGRPHPAFVAGGRIREALYFSKYENVVIDSRAYSLPFVDPAVDLTFKEALNVCQNKGSGFHLATRAEMAYLTLGCMKNGFIPRGNTKNGRHHSRSEERGIPSACNEKGQITRVQTGSGPDSWYHNGTKWGIYGLTGNISKWAGGFRTVGGEIQLIPDNDAALNSSQAEDSEVWRAVMPDGTLVKPGTGGTLHYDCETPDGAGVRINTRVEYSSENNPLRCARKSFREIEAVPGLKLPPVLAELCLAPVAGSAPGEVYLCNAPGRECLPVCCGFYMREALAGPNYLYLNSCRDEHFINLGFYSAYIR